MEASPADREPEPTRTTLGDLVALVAGAALAASLTWYSQWPRLRLLAGRPAPEWFIVLLYAREVARKGCIALVPVILARKVRHRGPIRPGEFAALCVAFDQLMLAVYSWPALGILRPMPGQPNRQEVDMTRLWAWYVSTFAAAALAAVVLATRRHRLPRAVAGLLLVAAWYGLYDPCQHFVGDPLDPVRARLYRQLSPLGRAVVSELTWGLPFAVIGVTPAAFGALDAVRRRPGRTWVEWAGLAFALGWEIVIHGQNYLRYLHGDLGTRSPGIDAVQSASLVLAFLLALLAARLLDRPLRRWLGLDDGPALVPGSEVVKIESSPSE